jgi:hypothetical protein
MTHPCKLPILAWFGIASFLLSQMSKCCYGMITLSCCFASSKLGWGSDSFHCICNCDINTFGPLTILGSSIGLSKSLSTSKFFRIILNVSDGVCYLFFGNCVPRESEVSPIIDIKVLVKTLVLYIYVYFSFPKMYNIFYIGNSTVQKTKS